jgi:hypothetical protein
MLYSFTSLTLHVDMFAHQHDTHAPMFKLLHSMQELAALLKCASFPKEYSYHFHVLQADMNLKQDRAENALSELELAELSNHSAGQQQGEIMRLRAACFHKLERHELARECLFQSSMV